MSVRTRPVRVVVADDDARFRAALVAVLDDDDRFVVVGQVADGDGLAELADRAEADVVVVDVRMPLGGAEAVAALAAHFEGSSRACPWVCALSSRTDAATVAAMVGAGATGFLAKGSGTDVADALARCAGGEVVLAVPSAADALGQLLTAPADRVGTRAR